MSSEDSSFRQEVNIQDEAFDIDAMNNYHLYLSIGWDNLRFCVIDGEGNRCLVLQDYRFFNKLNIEEVIPTLNRIYDSDLFLKANFWKSINIIPKGQAFTLVPREFFVESSPEKYLRLAGHKSEESLVVVSEQLGVDALNVFYADKKLVHWFHKTYPNRVIDFTHQTATFIEGIKNVNRPGKKAQAHVYIDNHHFIIAVLKDQVLEFCNIFSYRTSNDFIYFLLFVLDELRLDKDSSELILYGNIEPYSEIFQLLNSYISQVQVFNENPKWLHFGYKFGEINNYYYFDLYATHLYTQSG